MFYRSYILFMVLLFTSVGAAQEQAIAPLVAKDLLAEAGLSQLWQAKLAVKDGERVEKLMLLGDKICALTSDNYLFCLNRDNGSLAFGMQLALQGFPVLEPSSYGTQLLVVAGNKLMQIDTAKGTTAYTQKFDYTVVCPVVRNTTNFYIAGRDRRIDVIAAADKVPMFLAAANNDSLPTSVLAADERVIFTTDRGNIVCISPTEPKLLWQYDTDGKITAAAVRDNNDLYAASWDTRLYRLSTDSGLPVWQYQLDGMPAKSPRVTRNIVYQAVTNKGVTAIDKNKGHALWTVDGGIELLAQAGGRSYIMTKDRTVAVVDNAACRQLFSMNFAPSSLEAANTVDGKIYVADRAGRLACITAAK